MKSRNVVPVLLADLREHLETSTTHIAYGVACDGSLYAVAPEARPTANDATSGTARRDRMSGEHPHRVLRWRAGETHFNRVLALPFAVSYVQTVPEGILFVGARCRWHPSGAEPNAVVVDETGRVLRELVLGDGIADVRVAGDGTIWVSYFDEGVFGNFGWNHPGPRPVGGAGLLAFSPTGEVRFSYDPFAAKTGDICDAYALNVCANGDAWVYFHTEFPIVKVAGDRYHAWSFGIGGARALAVQGDRGLLVGDYNGQNLGRVVQLQRDGVARLTEELSIMDDDGERIDGGTLFGVDDAMYVFKEGQAWLLRTW